MKYNREPLRLDVVEKSKGLGVQKKNKIPLLWKR